MNKTELAQEALARARGHDSAMNYGAIFEGFGAKGIAEEEIRPRENVLTFHAWRATGRVVKRGEHGVRVQTWIPVTSRRRDDDTGEEKEESFRRLKTAVVFHISQTKELDQ